MDIITILFGLFSTLTLLFALMVVFSPNPVKGALFLVAVFLMSAGLWILLEAEFLGLVLVLVYVGAVMTLFLFVVMMLNVEVVSLQKHLIKYFPIALLVIVLIAGMLVTLLMHAHYPPLLPVMAGADYNNTRALGLSLYTDFVYAFEVAGAILLVAIIAAITLAFRGKVDRLAQKPDVQVNVDPKSRLRIIKMDSEKKL
jgi:NADH-quinone oxidoreductase subunit J